MSQSTNDTMLYIWELRPNTSSAQAALQFHKPTQRLAPSHLIMDCTAMIDVRRLASESEASPGTSLLLQAASLRRDGQ